MEELNKEDKLQESDYTELSKEELQDIFEKSEKLGNKYLHAEYSPGAQRSYMDVPGWINDAEWLYEKVLSDCEDGDHLIEIGTYFGQSACRMGELIKTHGKDVKFDTIDTYEVLDPSMRAGFHPPQFIRYRFHPSLSTAPFSDIVRLHLNVLGVQDYVNLIICDSKIAWKLYDDESLKMVYIDGDHTAEGIIEDLNNYWPKVKKGGWFCGDDINYESVKESVLKFVEENNIPTNSLELHQHSWIIRK